MSANEYHQALLMQAALAGHAKLDAPAVRDLLAPMPPDDRVKTLREWDSHGLRAVTTHHGRKLEVMRWPEDLSPALARGSYSATPLAGSYNDGKRDYALDLMAAVGLIWMP